MTIPGLEWHDVPVKLHSGGWSNWVVDGDTLFKDEHIRELWVAGAKRCMKIHSGQEALTRPRIYGIPHGGTKWAEALATACGVRPLLVYSVADDASGQTPTFIVDDVATTGSSLQVFPEPSLVVVRRGPAQVTCALFDLHLPKPKDELHCMNLPNPHPPHYWNGQPGDPLLTVLEDAEGAVCCPGVG